MRSKAFIVGLLLGLLGGLVMGITLAALFWNGVARAIPRLVRHLFKRDEQINFEILLQ